MEFTRARQVDKENLELGLNIHRPGNVNTALYHLSKAAKILKMIGCSDWAEDIEQTHDSIKSDFEEARQRFTEAIKCELEEKEKTLAMSHEYLDKDTEVRR